MATFPNGRGYSATFVEVLGPALRVIITVGVFVGFEGLLRHLEFIDVSTPPWLVP